MSNEKSKQTDLVNDEEKVNGEQPDAEVSEKSGAADQQNSDAVDQLVEEQHQRIQELQEEIERLKDTQLRKTAEMDNMRKRVRRDREQIFQAARESALESFLPIYDDLIRTLQAMKESDQDSSYLDGVQLIANKFENVLDKHNVERIDETGVPFDVDLHDALMSQKPEDESVESGTVLQVLESGYKIGEKTLRHAKVIVSE
jgi:molecular chaperone GrpE